MKAEAIRNQLRQGLSTELDIRRKIIGLSALGLIDFTVISLYQTGIIKKLPDVPLAIFDSNKVNASKEAYMLGVPDGPVSATVYALTMVLAAAGGNASTGRQPIFDLLLGKVIAVNAIGAAYYLYDMIFRQKKACLYCLVGAAVNFASLILVAPLAQKSIRKLMGV